MDLKRIESELGITGQFRLQRPLAEGGMGTVYLAEQLSLAREVALKVMKRTADWQGDAERRFLAEAQLAARVSHPNMVRVLASGSGELGLYIVYELVQGESLRQRMDRGLEPAGCLDLATQACDALSAIHAAGIVHRDLKPENMLVTPDEVLKLTDLGIAKDLTKGLRTRTGVLFGTPPYMSPEQCLGQTIGPASDIYSFGVVLYEMAAGSLPFVHESPIETIEAHLHEEPKAPSSRNSNLAPQWDAAILKALRKRPEERYRTAAELADTLRAIRTKPEIRVPAQRTVSVRRPAASAVSPRQTSGVRTSSLNRSSATTPAFERPRAWRLAAAIAVGTALVGIGVWRAGRVRSAPPRMAAVPPAVSPEPPRPPARDALLAALASELTGHPRIEANLSPIPAPGGTLAFKVELLTIDRATIRSARLRVSLPGPPRARTTSAPKLTRETDRGDAGQPLELAADSGSEGRIWTATLGPASLRDGIDRYRLELPVASGSAAEPPRVSLECERPADYPWPVLASAPASIPSSCGEQDEAVASAWSNYLSTEYSRALVTVRAALSKQPDCPRALEVYGALMFRGCEVQNEIALPEARLMISTVSAYSGELMERPIPELWREGTRSFNRLLAFHPRSGNYWRNYGEWLRRNRRPLEGLRAGIWSVLLEPGVGESFCQLGLTQSAVSRIHQGAGDRRWQDEARQAMTCLNRGLSLGINSKNDIETYRIARDEIVKRLGK